MSLTLAKMAAAFALLAALAAGCGTAAAGAHPAPTKPATVHHQHTPAAHGAATTHPAAPSHTPAKTANPVLQETAAIRTPTTTMAK